MGTNYFIHHQFLVDQLQIKIYFSQIYSNQSRWVSELLISIIHNFMINHLDSQLIDGTSKIQGCSIIGRENARFSDRSWSIIFHCFFLKIFRNNFSQFICDSMKPIIFVFTVSKTFWKRSILANWKDQHWLIMNVMIDEKNWFLRPVIEKNWW